MIKLSNFNSAWPDEFKHESQRIQDSLGETIANIYHIGSTSIPDIKAKPIIDILLEVSDLEPLDSQKTAMETLGYEAMGEFGIPERRYYRLNNAQGIRKFQVHAFESGSHGAMRHLAYRDYLLAHPHIAQSYSKLKERLVAQHPNDMDAYIDGKDSFIKDHERKALEWIQEIKADYED